MAGMEEDFAMSRRCELTAKGPQVGHKVSHSNIKTKRRFLPNLCSVTMISDALGRSVKLRGFAVDPDGDHVSLQWWQYGEEGTYPGKVTISSPDRAWTTVTVPADAQPGQTISLILQGTDDGNFPLTRYSRIVLQVA